MNYQEALDKVKELTTKMYADFVYHVATKGSMILLESEIGDNLDILQQLIDIYPEYLGLKEKATPMKPTVKMLMGVRHVDCPNCDDGYAHKYDGVNKLNVNYCSNCGKEFDWSKE